MKTVYEVEKYSESFAVIANKTFLIGDNIKIFAGNRFSVKALTPDGLMFHEFPGVFFEPGDFDTVDKSFEFRIHIFIAIIIVATIVYSLVFANATILQAILGPTIIAFFQTVNIVGKLIKTNE